MKRKAGTLLDIEVSILAAAAGLEARGLPECHGYLLAREMRERSDARRLVAHGTLYKALDRLEASGLLDSVWEDPHDAALEARPRRRLYRLTPAGHTAFAASIQRAAPSVLSPAPSAG